MDALAGLSLEDAENSAGEKTLSRKVNLNDTIDLKKGKRQISKVESSGVKDSCDLGLEDAMEGMIGGNFNTFGEHAPNVVF